MTHKQPKTFTFKNKDGLNIFNRTWSPEGQAMAIVVIIPGFNSHSGYYQWAAEQLIARNYVVYAIDLEGRGQSDGERFYVQSFNDYADEAAQLVTIAKREQPGLPVYVLGHSAGGVVACLYTLEHQNEISGLICESFAHQLPAPDFALAVLKGLSHLAPHAHVLKLNNADFSRDAQAVETMNNDPLIANEVQPTKTIAQMVIADERLKKDFPLITLPVLILHGTADKATKPSGSQFFYDTTGSTDKTIKLYEGHYHDMLNDTDKEVVMADILQWLTAHTNA